MSLNDNIISMACSLQFSINDHNNQSIENELYHTDGCVSNKFKISIYVIFIILWGTIFIWISGVLLTNCIVSKFKYNLIKYLYALLILGSLSGIISHSLFLAGVQHWARFFILPLSTFGVRHSTSILLKTWFNISLGLTGSFDKDLKKKLIIFLDVMNGITYVSYFVCFMLGSLIASSQENYLLLNWFYVSGVSIAGINNTFMCMFVIYISGKLISVCISDATSDDIKNFCDKLVLVRKFAYIHGGFQICIALVPFWMFNFEGVFYFQFFVYELTICTSTFAQFCIISKKGEMFGLISHISEIESPPITVRPSNSILMENTETIIKELNPKVEQ